jgi:hypothetical protein
MCALRFDAFQRDVFFLLVCSVLSRLCTHLNFQLKSFMQHNIFIERCLVSSFAFSFIDLTGPRLDFASVSIDPALNQQR